MHEIALLLKKIAAPLDFVSKEDFRHLPLVKDFESAMTGIVRLLRQKTTVGGLLPPDALSMLEESFSGFDNLTLEDKKERVKAALAILRDLPLHPDKDDVREIADPVSPVQEHGDVAAPAVRNLQAPVQYVKGVGPKIAEMFARKGLQTIEDLVYFLPRHYEDRRSIATIAAAVWGKKETVIGEVLRSEIKPYARRRDGDHDGDVVQRKYSVHQEELYRRAAGHPDRRNQGVRVR